MRQGDFRKQGIILLRKESMCYGGHKCVKEDRKDGRNDQIYIQYGREKNIIRKETIQ